MQNAPKNWHGNGEGEWKQQNKKWGWENRKDGGATGVLVLGRCSVDVW